MMNVVRPKRRQRADAGSQHVAQNSSSFDVDWASKYAPRSIDALAVRKAKIGEVRDFLQSGKNLGIITGPPGCGKSSTLHLLCDEMDIDATEFTPEVQISWQEMMDIRGKDKSIDSLSYVSKLDAFEAFCERAWMPSLTGTKSINTSESPAPTLQKQKLVILDDIPIAVGHDQTARLAKTVFSLISRSRIPIIFILYEVSSNSRDNDGHGRLRHGQIPRVS